MRVAELLECIAATVFLCAWLGLVAVLVNRQGRHR